MGQGALVGLFSPGWGLCPFVPRDVLVLVFWWGWSQGEGFHTVEGDGVFPGPVGQDVYARVSRYGAQVHVARDGGGRQRLAEGRGAWGGAGRVMVLRGKQELRVYAQPVHMLAQVRGGPEVVELNEYLEGKVGQPVPYPNVLRPESLPKKTAG